MINKTIAEYRIKKLALIQKIPTPIVPMKMDNEGHITLAYFDKKSTVDYIGNVQEIPVCFDAKECKTDKFPLRNIHKHQVDFMKEWEEQGGIAFILIYFSNREIGYYMRCDEVIRRYNSKKDFKIDELDDNYFINLKNKIKVDFLTLIQKDIDSREEHS